MTRRAAIINNNNINSRRADIELPAINSANIFCALETKKKPGKKNNKGTREQQNHQQEEPVQAWTLKPISVVTSWADCEDDEDDEFFALPVLPPLPPQQPLQDELSQAEESEEDERESDEEIEEQQETEANEAAGSDASSVVTTAHEPDKQLSKKELKRRELAELDAVLAELGLNHQHEKVSRKESNDDESQSGINRDLTGEVAGSGASPTKSKNSKRHKAKKDKLPEEERDKELPLHTNALLRPDTSTEEDAEFNMVPSDPKVVMKRLVSKKKKKSSKDSDGAAKAAVAEASARAEKLAASKKKEKSHYNQRPAR